MTEDGNSDGVLKRKLDDVTAVAPAVEANEPSPVLPPPASAITTNEEEILVGQPYRGVLPRRVDALDHGCLVISQGSVVDFRGDAIVNAANRGCLGGGGVDGAINDAGGYRLEEARRELPVLRPYVRCETGDAKVTIGGDLHVAHVIHAVGPDYRSCESDEAGDKLLVSAFKASMQAAAKLGAATVAFSLISAAIFRGDRPLRTVLSLAIRAVREEAYPHLHEVHLVAFTITEIRALLVCAQEALGSVTYDPGREEDAGELDPQTQLH